MIDPDKYLEQHAKKFEAFYNTGVLVPSKHHRMLGNIKEYAKQAGIQPMDVARPFSETCDYELELSFVLHCIREEYDQINGLYYTGDMDPPIMDRHKVFAGTILRHFRKVKLLNQNLFFGMQHSGFDFSGYHTLCIPDLFTNIISLGDWHRRALSGLITERYLDGQQLILGKLAAPQDMLNVLGEDAVGIIKKHYVRIGLDGE